MNDNFWTVIKIVAAIAATILIYNFLDPDSSIEFNSFSNIDTSIEKLGEILSASIEDRDARREAELEFNEFSDMVIEGEIAPEEFEEIASSILNMRMSEISETDERNQAIIRQLRRAQFSSNVIAESQEELDVKLESIALKIKDLTTFQEEYYGHFLHSDMLADLKNAPEVPEVIEQNTVEMVKVCNCNEKKIYG